MSLANLKSTGFAKVRYALVIEGWPHIFVTDPALTLATDKGDRTVIAGMKYEGLRFHERALPKDGKYEGSAITFKFVPEYTQRTTSGHVDPISAAFSKRGTAVASLEFASTLSESATTIDLQGSSTLSNNTYYYIGTETIKTGTFPTIARAQYGSYAQIHSTSYIDSTREIQIYDYPTTMDGRRVYLYIYGEGDSVLTLSGNNIIWRGLVAMPPKREDDGVTWSLYCNHVSHAWRQSLVAHQVDVRIVGIYVHERSPIRIVAVADSEKVNYWVAGFFREPENLCAAVNAKLDDALIDLSLDASTEIAFAQLQYDYSVNQYVLVFKTGSAPPTFVPFVASPLIGATDPRVTYLRSTGAAVNYENLAANKTYISPLVMPLSSENIAGRSVIMPSLEAASSPSAGILGPNTLAFVPDNEAPADDDPIHDYPADRLYISHDLSAISTTNYISIGADEVSFPSDATSSRYAYRGGVFLVTDTDQDGDGTNYITIAPVLQNAGVGNQIGEFRGFLTGESEIKVLVDYSSPGSFTFTVVDFIDSITDRRIYANDGITPYLVPEDFDTTQLQGAPSLETIYRTYQFVEPVTIEDVVSHELLLAGHMLYTTSTGKLGVRQLPIFTDVHVTTKTVTGSKIITPADGYGAWPGYQLHPQGIVATVHIQTGYIPADDEWRGRSFEVRDPDLISRHKKRGVGEVTIAPRSNAAAAPEMDNITAQMVAAILLAFMGREYAAVRVKVPFTAFDYLLGDVVTLTSPHVPNGDGTVGVTGKRAVVMRREWNLDPKVEEWGELELWILLDSPPGYAPSAVITAQADQGSNLWNLTCSVANDINLRLSTSGDGLCLQHFADADYVRVIERNVDPINQQTGRISGSPNASAGTCVVQFDGVWTPGAGTWVLEFQVDNGTTAQSGQRSYCYVADTDKKLASGSSTRLFS